MEGKTLDARRACRGPSRSRVLADGTKVRYVSDDHGDQTVLLDRGNAVRPDEGYEAPFRVYLPYAVRRQLTMDGAPSNTTWVDVSASNVAYYAALCDWWSKGETFMVIEHDVVVTAEVVAELDACPEPWCLFAYDDFCCRGCWEAWRNLLGCTRFRAEVVEAVPDAMESIPESNWDWHNVCDGLGNNLRAAGFTHHWHEPPVIHRHEPVE